MWFKRLCLPEDWQTYTIGTLRLISRESIEERRLEVLKFKSSLFAGALDGGANEIFMGESKFRQFMNAVENVASAPRAVSAPVADVEVDVDRNVGAGFISTQQGQTQGLPLHEGTEQQKFQQPPAPQPPVAELFSSAANFFGNLAATFSDPEKSERLVSSLIEKDVQSGKSYLKIPVENEQAVSNALNALSALLGGLKKICHCAAAEAIFDYETNILCHYQ